MRTGIRLMSACLPLPGAGERMERHGRQRAFISAPGCIGVMRDHDLCVQEMHGYSVVQRDHKLVID